MSRHTIIFSNTTSKYIQFRMKLDTKALRYLTAEDWRVLTAVRQVNVELLIVVD